MPHLKQAVVAGQYNFPRGLFFGGQEFQQALQSYRLYLSNRFVEAKRVIAIDTHTGLGPYGWDTLLVEVNQFTRMQKLFVKHVAPLHASGGIGYRVRGGLQEMLAAVFPEAR